MYKKKIFPVFFFLMLLAGYYYSIPGPRFHEVSIQAPSGKFRAFLAVPPPNVSPKRKMLICSHGTNSHKEVFLPVAWEMARSGLPVISIDSSILSTDEGVASRAREIFSAIEFFRDEGKLVQFEEVAFLGHSDGVPPSLDFPHRFKSIKTGEVFVLGSFLNEKATGLSRVSGYTGCFDQVFPPFEMENDFKVFRQSAKLQHSWMSDHFTEQYDPLLLEKIANDLLDTPDKTRFQRIGLNIIAFSSAIIFSFLIGNFISSSCTSMTFRLVFLFGGPTLWLMLNGNPWLIPQLPAFLVGGSLPDIFKIGFWRSFFIFFLLTCTNIAITSKFFWANFAEAALWLPLVVPWYFTAWIAKIGLFLPSFLNRLNPDFLEKLPIGVIVLSLTGFYLPWIENHVRHFLSNEPAAPATCERRYKTRLAWILSTIMILFWTIRFFQGFVHMEVLASVVENFSKMLVLPAIYIILRITGRVSI